MYTDKVVSDGGTFKPVFFGFIKTMLVALGVTAVVFFAAALLLTYTGLSEKAIPFIVILTMALSVMLAGAIAAKAGKRRGYISGSFTGILYAFVLYVTSLLVSGEFFCNLHTLALLGVGLIGGAVGGILGVNIRAKGKRY